MDFVIQKPELQGLGSQMSNPSGVCSLWTHFVWFKQSFYKFRISCQHKQIWQFHIRLYISSFSWKSGTCANSRPVYFLASMSLSWVVTSPLNGPHPHLTLLSLTHTCSALILLNLSCKIWVFSTDLRITERILGGYKWEKKILEYKYIGRSRTGTSYPIHTPF